MKLDCYSLWLMPEPRTLPSQMLATLVNDVAAVFCTPLFKPHVTLLGGMKGHERDIRDSTRKLAKALSPFKVEFGDIGSNGTYLQILFAEVKQTGNILRANAMAQRVFGLTEEYFPHCSLAYGDLNEGEVAHLHGLVVTKKWQLLKKGSFLAKRIELWHAKGTVEEWYRVETFPLGDT